MTRLRVFLASPGDVPRERNSVRVVLEELNQTLANANDCTVELHDWSSKTWPNIGDDPQSVINAQMEEMGTFDVFVGIMWNRIGTQTPRALSGTIEEYLRANAVRLSKGLPEIWFYFCTRPATLDTPDQLAQRGEVLKFRSNLKGAGTTGTYESPEDFEKQFRRHFTLYLNKRWKGREPDPNGVSLEQTVSLVSQACQTFVKQEVQARVGRKYIPELVLERPIEREIREFLDQDLEQLRVEICIQLLQQLVRQHSPKSLPAPETWNTLREYLNQTDLLPLSAISECFPSLPKQVQSRISDLVVAAAVRRNCFLIRDKAGSGKTNLLCRLSGIENPRDVSLFLTCKFDVAGVSRMVELIGHRLQAHVQNSSLSDASPGDLLKEVAAILHERGQQLVIYVDGINENRELSRIDHLILEMLRELNALPVKFIITCRDIFWSYFTETAWQPFLYDAKPHDLPAFTDQELDAAINTYFQHFQIRGEITGTARKKCCHPLLLRFFCEAYRDRDIRQFRDLRLRDLFEEYWKRKNGEIAVALGLPSEGAFRVEEFLFRLGDYMSANRVTRVVTGEITAITGESDLDTDNSLYQRFLDEDIILEELPPENSFDPFRHSRRVSFVYDEFFDFILAVSHIRRHKWDTLTLPEIGKDFVSLVEESANFEQFRGVAEYLVLMAERRSYHQVLCALLAKLGRYEVLCGVLPKLRGDTEWMISVLGECLRAGSAPSLAGTANTRRDMLPEKQDWRAALEAGEKPEQLFAELLGHSGDAK